MYDVIFVIKVFLIFGRPFVKRFALRYRYIVCLPVLSSLSVLTMVYCGQTLGWIKMKLRMEVGSVPATLC